MIKQVQSIQKSGYFSRQISENQKQLGIKAEDKKGFQQNLTRVIEKASDEKSKTSELEQKEKQAQESLKELSSNSQKLREFISSQREVVKERIKNKQEGPAIQIGKESMTAKEWEKLMKKVDDEIEAVKKRHEKEEEEKAEKALEQKDQTQQIAKKERNITE